MSPGLISDSVRSDNEGKYRSGNPVVRRLLARFLRQVGDLAQIAAPRRVLEVGCGEGLVIRYLARRLPGVRIDGVELDARALERARLHCPDASLVRGDVCELPVRRGAYDLVLCLEVLEHLEDPARALQELRRASRGGCLLSVPHEPYFRLGNLLRGKNLRRLGDPSDHVQHWGAREFRTLCAQHLTVRRSTTSFPWLIVLGVV